MINFLRFIVINFIAIQSDQRTKYEVFVFPEHLGKLWNPVRQETLLFSYESSEFETIKAT